jgi:hypothetical protein
MLNAAFFATPWYRKQKLIQYSRKQKAIHHFIVFIRTAKENQKLSAVEAKKIIVAYGDALPQG